MARETVSAQLLGLPSHGFHRAVPATPQAASLGGAWSTGLTLHSCGKQVGAPFIGRRTLPAAEGWAVTGAVPLCAVTSVSLQSRSRASAAEDEPLAQGLRVLRARSSGSPGGPGGPPSRVMQLPAAPGQWSKQQPLPWHSVRPEQALRGIVLFT